MEILIQCRRLGESCNIVWQTAQVKNYGYIPSPLPDAKCYGDQAPKSVSDITKALADVFARLPGIAPPLIDQSTSSASSQPQSSANLAASTVGSYAEASSRDLAAATSSGAAASTAAAAEGPQVVPHQGVDALFEYLEK